MTSENDVKTQDFDLYGNVVFMKMIEAFGTYRLKQHVVMLRFSHNMIGRGQKTAAEDLVKISYRIFLILNEIAKHSESWRDWTKILKIPKRF